MSIYSVQLQSSRGTTVKLNPILVSAEVAISRAGTYRFELPEIKYGVFGNSSHRDLFEKIDEIREKLFAAPHPADNPNTLWIFEATRKTFSHIEKAQAHLHKKKTPDETPEIYEKALKCFQRALRCADEGVHRTELEEAITKTNENRLLLKWSKVLPRLLKNSEIVEFHEVIDAYKDEDLLSGLDFYLDGKIEAPHEHLLSALFNEERCNFDLAIESYLNLSKESASYSHISKAYKLLVSLAKKNRAYENVLRKIDEAHKKVIPQFVLQEAPSCFICVNVEEKDVKEWITNNLAPDLERLGIQTILCLWDLSIGDEILEFEEEASRADFAIIACTPELKRKSENCETGVAQELKLLKKRSTKRKYKGTTFPVYLKGSRREDFPNVFFEGVFGPKFQLESSGEEHSKFNYYYHVIELFAVMKGLEQSRRKAAEVQKAFLEEIRNLISAGLQAQQPVNLVTLPKPLRNFVGRQKDLTYIFNQFQTKDRVALAGLGGMGKTSLSLAYAEKNKANYKWMHQVQAESIERDLLKLAERLEVVGTNDDQKLHNLKSHLTKQNNYLLILDGVDTKEKYEELENHLSNIAGKVLLTTRKPETAMSYNYLVRLLKPLKPKESAFYILEETQRENHEAGIELANILGNHPLALTHAARYIRSTGIAISEYQTLFRTNPEIHQDVELKENEKTIITTWEVSLDRIINHHKCPEAESLLNFLSHLAHSAIPLELLDTWRINHTDPVLTKPQFLKTIKNLVNYSLISIAAPRQYEVHPLVKYVTRHKQENQGSEKLKTLNLLNKHIENYNMQDRSEREEGIELAPHIEYLLAYAWQAEIISSHLPFINLSFKLFECYRHNGNYTKALALETKNLERLKKIHGEKHPYVARSLNNVGSTLGDLGRHEEALVRKSEALALRKELLGEKHPDVASSLNNVGCTLGNLGRHEEALVRKSEALALFKELLGEKHPYVASSLNNVGVTLRALGRHEEALVRQSEALALRKELLGEKHPYVASSLNNVGSTLGDLGRHEEALVRQSEALALRKELLGEKHPDVARSLNNVGVTLRALGRHEEALVRLSEALALRKELLGEKHPDVAISLNNVGSTLGDLGRHEEALVRLSEALALFKELLGEKHPYVASSLDNMGSTLGDLGRHEKALERKSEALALRKELLGEKHPNVASSLNNVGCTMYSLERFTEALDYFIKALEITRESLGEKHPSYAVRQKNKELAEEAIERQKGRGAGSGRQNRSD